MRIRSLLPILSAAVLSLAAPATTSAQTIVVIVNAANPVSALSKDQLSDLFLKKVTRWTNGQPVVPVDQDRNAKIRDAFSRSVHQRSVAAITSYWQTQIFSGNNVPPATKAHDAEVLAFVRGNPNAIGYVNADTPLDANVKAVTVGGL